MNLGQSEFQDTYFVAGAQLTPYRQLRQIELELRSIEDALHQSSIGLRRAALKLAKIDTSTDEGRLDAEELSWGQLQQEQLYKDAMNRKANFLRLKQELLDKTPQEYWDRGYEAAEAEHWPAYFAKQIGTAMAMGLPPPQNIVEQVLLLPNELQKKCVLLSQQKAETLKLAYGPST